MSILKITSVTIAFAYLSDRKFRVHSNVLRLSRGSITDRSLLCIVRYTVTLWVFSLLGFCISYPDFFYISFPVV